MSLAPTAFQEPLWICSAHSRPGLATFAVPRAIPTVRLRESTSRTESVRVVMVMGAESISGSVSVFLATTRSWRFAADVWVVKVYVPSAFVWTFWPFFQLPDLLCSVTVRTPVPMSPSSTKPSSTYGLALELVGAGAVAGVARGAAAAGPTRPTNDPETSSRPRTRDGVRRMTPRSDDRQGNGNTVLGRVGRKWFDTPTR